MNDLEVAVPVLTLAESMWLLVMAEREQKRDIVQKIRAHVVADGAVAKLARAVRDAVGTPA